MKKLFGIITSALLLSGCVSNANNLENTDWLKTTENVLNAQLFGTTPASALSTAEITAGLKEALNIGSENVVSKLGVTNGFNLDSKVHIPLPDTLEKVDKALSTIGMDKLTNDLELRLNRAAEMATPKAKALFISAISQMTIEDAKGILTGPQDAATQYLRRTMGPQLSQDIKPIISAAITQAGAVQAYDQVMGQYAQIPFMPDVKANLNDFVIEKTLDGIFYYVAAEEAAIRQNPARRTTELLRKVFAN